jgi:hypothetical protein
MISMTAVVVQVREMAVAGIPMSGSVSSFLSATKPEMAPRIKNNRARFIIKFFFSRWVYNLMRVGEWRRSVFEFLGLPVYFFLDP